MDDARVWEFEKSLWVGEGDIYRRAVDERCVMALPRPPYILSGAEAIDAVANTPRWSAVSFSEQRVERPQEGLIVVGYRVEAQAGGVDYVAHCTSTYRREAHDDWRVVQHQQTPDGPQADQA